MTKVPSTNPHKLSAERVAKVTKALIRRLVEKGVLSPPRKGVLPQPQLEPLKPSSARIREEQDREFMAASNEVLDCRGPARYRAFSLIEGGKQDAATETPQGETSDGDK